MDGWMDGWMGFSRAYQPIRPPDMVMVLSAYHPTQKLRCGELESDKESKKEEITGFGSLQCLAKLIVTVSCKALEAAFWRW